VWENPVISIDSATPQTAVYPALPGTCTTTDINWIYRPSD